MERRLMAVSAIMLGVLAGCAGRDFVRPDRDALRNGRTTYAEVVAKFGAPYAEGSVIKNGKTVKTASYAYASLGGKPRTEGVTAARAMGFYFHEDRLVGHEFVSSWAEDHTDFDESRAKYLVKGKTSRAEATRHLGKPGGYYIFPLIKSLDGEAAVYTYTEVTGFRPFKKVLVVTFDATGIVTDVEFTSTESK